MLIASFTVGKMCPNDGRRTASRDAFNSLLSGYSSATRARKVLVMLTAYFDDSGSERGERMLILAGYVHSAQTWLAFNDDWQTVLETAPAIKYLHMVEAENLRDEFKGWVREEMEEKVSALADVIVKHEPWSIECQVSRQDFSDIVQPVVSYELRTPYFACFYGVICNLVKWHASMGLTLPIDFVFDEQGAIGAQGVLWYEDSVLSRYLRIRLQPI